MKRYSLRHLSDAVLARALVAAVAGECASTADALAHVAEFDSRKLYRPAGYSSMYAYCLGGLHMSEDMAYKRIQAARAARRFPAILQLVARGRLHLSAVCLVAPHLNEDTADELLVAATHKTKAEVVLMLAQRFPQPDVPQIVRAITTISQTLRTDELAPGQVQVPDELALAVGPATESATPEAARPQLPAPLAPTLPVPDRSRVKPLAPQRFAVQFTMSQSAHDKLRHVQELLGHQVASGDLAQIFERALDALIPQLEKRKFAATSTPRPRREAHPSDNARHIPAHVRRAVWKRDEGQCTYRSDDGHRCEERKGLQFDHILEVARGGEASVSDIRLRCHAHNQLEAERTFGSEFMRHKRIAAEEARAARRARAAATQEAGNRTSALLTPPEASP